jgi:hypothetical protein
MVHLLYQPWSLQLSAVLYLNPEVRWFSLDTCSSSNFKATALCEIWLLLPYNLDPVGNALYLSPSSLLAVSRSKRKSFWTSTDSLATLPPYPATYSIRSSAYINWFCVQRFSSFQLFYILLSPVVKSIVKYEASRSASVPFFLVLSATLSTPLDFFSISRPKSFIYYEQRKVI